MCLADTGELNMADINPMPVEEQEIMWVKLSLMLLKALEHERIKLTRLVASTNDPQLVRDHRQCVIDQSDILEEFFNRVSKYLEKHGTAKTLASHTLQEILSILVCESCGEI
jgi:hypothetical protein